MESFESALPSMSEGAEGEKRSSVGLVGEVEAEEAAVKEEDRAVFVDGLFKEC